MVTQHFMASTLAPLITYPNVYTYTFILSNTVLLAKLLKGSKGGAVSGNPLLCRTPIPFLDKSSL